MGEPSPKKGEKGTTGRPSSDWLLVGQFPSTCRGPLEGKMLHGAMFAFTKSLVSHGYNLLRLFPQQDIGVQFRARTLAQLIPCLSLSGTPLFAGIYRGRNHHSSVSEAFRLCDFWISQASTVRFLHKRKRPIPSRVSFGLP